MKQSNTVSTPRHSPWRGAASMNLYDEESVVKKEENFSNGRLVRNLYDDLIMNHARRVINIIDPSKNDLSLITSDDFKTDL